MAASTKAAPARTFDEFLDKFETQYFVWKDSMLLDDESKYASKLIVPEAERALYKSLHTELVAEYCRYCRQSNVPAETSKQDANLILSSSVPRDLWQYMVGTEPADPDVIHIDFLDGLYEIKDATFMYREVQEAVRNTDTMYVQCDNVYYELNADHPLWMIPISLPWARKQAMAALAKHNHVTYYTTQSLEKLQLLLRWAHFHSVSPSSKSFVPMVFSLQNDHDAHGLGSFVGWKYFRPMHKIFAKWHPEVNWSVWVGVSRKDAEAFRDKVVVPQYTLLAELVGELRQSRDGDHYQCEVSSAKDIVMTCYTPNMPLIGGAGFLVNMSCDKRQRLCNKIESNGLRKHQTFYLEVQGVDTEHSSRHQGPFLHCPLNRDLTGDSFLNPPATMTTETVYVDGDAYLLLPVEISYFENEDTSSACETVMCGCLTSCAKKPPEQRSRIQTLGDVQGRPAQKARKQDEFDLEF